MQLQMPCLIDFSKRLLGFCIFEFHNSELCSLCLQASLFGFHFFELCSHVFESCALKFHVFELCSCVFKSCLYVSKPYVPELYSHVYKSHSLGFSILSLILSTSTFFWHCLHYTRSLFLKYLFYFNHINATHLKQASWRTYKNNSNSINLRLQRL